MKKFSEIEYKRPDFEALRNSYATLMERFKKSKQGVFAPKNRAVKKGRDTLTVNSDLKKPEFCGSVSFPHIRG